MNRGVAAGGSALFLAVVPGTVAGVIPWWITRWRFTSPTADWLPVRCGGALLLAASGGFLIHAFARFVVDGIGTPAPIAPPEHLVVTGVYRYVRNPMYLAVTAALGGQALLFGQLWLMAYAVIFLLVTMCFVRWYEEPTLARQFGEQYQAYRSAVPGWWPRRHPWTEPAAE